jgi:hypothetical protein
MSSESTPSGRPPGSGLTPDCERCCGLCCVAPAFAASPDFAIDKRAGEPCPNLTGDFRCSIHHRLRAEGFRGCVAYDCHGAGQKVTQVTFGGQDWRRSPGIASQMFEVFGVMRQVHALLLYLTEALGLGPAEPLHADLRRMHAELEGCSLQAPEALLQLDLRSLRGEVDDLLLRVSALVRA